MMVADRGKPSYATKLHFNVNAPVVSTQCNTHSVDLQMYSLVPAGLPIFFNVATVKITRRPWYKATGIADTHSNNLAQVFFFYQWKGNRLITV